MTKRIFLTFTDDMMAKARRRICRQARAMKIYTRIIGASEYDLDPEFRKHFEKHLVPGAKGFGYFAWKPQIVRQTLDKMKNDDILHYVDAGCHLNPKGGWRLKEYFALAQSSPTGILGFEHRPPEGRLHYDGRQLPDYAEYKYTKGDLIDRLRVRNNNDLLNQQQIVGTTFFIRKCDSSVAFVNEWLSIPYEKFSLIDDTPSVSPNIEGFIVHRHDQSIFSLLGKLRGITTISDCEFSYLSQEDCRYPDWEALKDFPIHKRRDHGMLSEKEILWLKIKGKIKRMIGG
jgi:hypothetical protein